MGYDNFSNRTTKDSAIVNSKNTHEILSRKMFTDGFGLVLDLVNSHDLILVDEKTGDEYLDFFSFFASSPVGINHPKMIEKDFLEEISECAVNNPSNSDIYTVQMARFVETFSKIAVPDFYKHMFFVSGGTLAVENALKTAFDWKVKKNFKKGYKEERGHKIIHFREAFHGRSGYTMSLTNTDPVKTALFPKFDWPRITNPKIIFPLSDNLPEIEKNEATAINEILNAIKNNKDDIAAIIIEPIQGEGGDNFFRKEFFIKLREIADQNEILLIFDEVQTGIGMTGKMWAFEHFVNPDIISFGKKVQVCGILVNGRIDDIDDNVFKVSSRINSTWGGNLTDMVRSRKYFEIINEENLIVNAMSTGKYLLEKIEEVQNEFPHLVSQARGLGLMCSFNLPNPQIRKQFLSNLYKNKMIMLGCGINTVRFRPPLTITKSYVDLGIKIIKETLHSL